ncbi:hypothetical protein QUF95_15400 [Paenibacillus silvae]|uniref:hypothetical protein n=1 Tax=Paenibacillus silvae TaxID=1325358 RepID=UPI00259FF795|nr:hypothetical protein [Paenibacillus silvae]MDM5278783.1 hypothetical protein [Paenibacillus silvae]
MRKVNKWIPIGIIAALIIALPTVWILYEKKKEADRQDLIHMGDKLRVTMDEYKETETRLKGNENLAREYTDLMSSVLDGKVKVADVREEVCGMEKELMELYPTIYMEPSSVCGP